MRNSASFKMDQIPQSEIEEKKISSQENPAVLSESNVIVEDNQILKIENVTQEQELNEVNNLILKRNETLENVNIYRFHQ